MHWHLLVYNAARLFHAREEHCIVGGKTKVWCWNGQLPFSWRTESLQRARSVNTGLQDHFKCDEMSEPATLLCFSRLLGLNEDWRLKKELVNFLRMFFFSSFFWNGFGWVGELPAASNANLWANLPLQTSVAFSLPFSPSFSASPHPPPLASSLLKKPSRLFLTAHMHSRQVLQTGDWKRKTLTRHRSVGLNTRGGLVCHAFEDFVYSVVFNHHVLGSADLAEFGGSFGLWGPEEGVGVLQPAAEWDLADIVISPVAAHLPLAVGQHLGHADGAQSWGLNQRKNLNSAGLKLNHSLRSERERAGWADAVFPRKTKTRSSWRSAELAASRTSEREKSVWVNEKVCVREKSRERER